MSREVIVRAAFFIERYILSLVFLYLAWTDFESLVDADLWSSKLGSEDIAYGIRLILMFFVNFCIGVVLLVSRRPASKPGNIKEIIVPFLASFYFYTYSIIPYLPDVLQNSFLPQHLQTLFAEAGFVIGAIGPAISAWGVYSLGRSFGIFVSVRKVVLHGPYRYVRHPIYLGYFFLFSGLALAYLSAAVLILVPIHFALFVWRARLEEARLSSFSSQYAEYMKHTGFLFPKFPAFEKSSPGRQ